MNMIVMFIVCMVSTATILRPYSAKLSALSSLSNRGRCEGERIDGGFVFITLGKLEKNPKKQTTIIVKYSTLADTQECWT